ncbi:MAG: hypothetical protein Q8O83_02140, partial [bacterium]|nr:hypothetical protein [bacterium]
GYFNDVKKELAINYANIPDIESMINQVFVVEYKKLIENALLAFDNLGRATDLNTDEKIAYFTMIPIRHWPKMVKRRGKFLAGKKFNERSLVKEDRFWQDYECVAEEFDRMGKTRHKQKNKKRERR